MPVDQLPTRRAVRSPGDAKLVQYDQYIDTQIQNTRRAVKAVDWATSLLELAIGVLLFLLVVAVVDHWIIPGGFPDVMRVVLFVVMVGSVCYFAYRRLWPLCRRAINPVYAAQTIEQASPTLKNSLINLLLFRQHRTDIPDAVFQTLEEQAAQRLTRVSVETAVDRTALIRIGYVLLAVVAVAGLYKVLSPKDPVIAAQRVLLPWSDIVPASRVAIAGVMPGSVTVSRGEFLDVSAEIRGIDDEDTVLLRYSTDDGQALDKPIAMTLAPDGLRFTGRLPEGAAGSDRAGLAQNVRYRIEAGDARSLDYNVTVVPAPSIMVERVAYDYPDYTGFVDRHVEGIGDIRAIEGTRVTIQARANGPIKAAEVDFDADGRPDLKMTGQEDEARASFVLELREDRQTPRHASYVLRFTNTEGRSNREPVKSPIAVEPDLSPEAAILRPQEKAIDLPLNGTVTIEAEARDPDFALAGVRLHGEVAGRPILDEPLLTSKHTGRFTGRYQFTPSALKLRAGDVVQYWVTASDNRTPSANTAESERKLMRILSPDPAQQPPPDRIARNDRQQQPNQQRDNQQQPGDQQQQKGDQQQQGGDQQGGGQNPQNGQSPARESTSADGQQQRGGEQQRGDQQTSRDAQRTAEPGQSNRANQGNEQSRQQDKQPGQQGEGQRRDGETTSVGGNQQRRDGDRQPNDEQTGAGAAGNESSQRGSRPAGTRPDEHQAKRPSDAEQREGEQPQPAAEKAPVSSEGDHDAEAFERIQRHMERTGELKEGDSPSPSNSEQRRSDAEPSAQQQQGQGENETGKQGEEQGPESTEAQGSSAQDKNRDGQPSNRVSQPNAEQRPGNGEASGAET
jgi:hypothetical protein